MANELLNELNAFRANNNLAPFADWRKSRHQPMLDAYRAEATKTLSTDFEMPAGELATQERVVHVETETAPAPIAPAVEQMGAEQIAKLAASFHTEKTVSTPEEIKTRRAERATRIALEKAEAKANRVLSYKELARIAPDKSKIEKPVDLIHAYLATHYGTKKRKELIAELVAMGLNIHTCRTQYQIYHVKMNTPTAASE